MSESLVFDFFPHDKDVRRLSYLQAVGTCNVYIFCFSHSCAGFRPADLHGDWYASCSAADLCEMLIALQSDCNVGHLPENDIVVQCLAYQMHCVDAEDA